MKQTATPLLFFMLLAHVAFGQKDEKLYYPSGELQQETKFVSDCNCYKRTEYYLGGKAHSTRTFVGNVPEGEDIIYFENGVIMAHNSWKNGTLDGRTYSNYENGKLGFENFYSNKFKSGNWKFYNEDGTLRKEELYEEGKTAWDSNDDFKTCKFYYKGKLAYTQQISMGKETGVTISDKEGYDKIYASLPPPGETIFRQNCAVCHAANVDIVGPKLKGVTERRTNDWLVKMIRNGDELSRSGDKDAVALYDQYKSQHPIFDKLTPEQVQQVISYLKTMK